MQVFIAFQKHYKGSSQFALICQTLHILTIKGNRFAWFFNSVNSNDWKSTQTFTKSLHEQSNFEVKLILDVTLYYSYFYYLI